MNTSTTTRERITIDDPPERLLDLVAWARNTVESVPEEHRAGATIELVTEDGYSGPETRIEVRFTRPATVKEMEDRHRIAREYDERQREQYEELRKKFGDQT